MNRLLIVLLLALQVAVTGCAALTRAKPVVTRRYAHHTFDQDQTPSVKITIFAVPVPAPTSSETSITSLAAQAQAELVTSMADRTKNQSAQSLVRALALPIQGERSIPSFRDLTRMSRRLVFSLDNRSREPANRVNLARIYVRPVGDTRFVSWNRIENVYETIDLGRLSLSQGRRTSAELGLTLPVLAASPQISASSESTLQEEVPLSQRRTALTGALTPTEAILLQQGGSGIDLTGNVTADVEFALPSGGNQTVFIPLLPLKDGAPACEQRPTFDRQTIRYPARSLRPGADTIGPDSVRLNVALEYVVREVMGGHATLTESDDTVVFRAGTSRIDSVAIIPAEALRFSVYELRLRDETVSIEGAAPGSAEEGVAKLQFATFEDAVAMLLWVRKCTIARVGYRLLLGERQLREDELGRLFVWRTPINYPSGEGGEVRTR